MIIEIENAIIGRLVAGFSSVGLKPEVIPFPAKPETWRSTHPKASVLVAYVGTTYGDSMSAGILAQEARAEFDVHVICPSLRHGGAYAYLLAARALLAGYRPAGAGKLTPKRDRFVSRKENRWTYVLTLECAAPTIEAAEDEIAALLRRIIAIDDDTGDITARVEKED